MGTTNPSQRESWKNTILAGLANYIDAGSIVSGAAALSLWAETYQLGPRYVGLIAAFSANAIAAGIGALAGGWLCDRFGRKKIYQYDMLFYAFGMAWLVFAFQPWMIVVGTVLVGLAVGADIPASWSLIAENAPRGQRGKHSGVAQLLWTLGPTMVLLMSFLLAPLGALGVRIVFAHLLILALLLTLLRSRIRESKMWQEAKSLRDRRTGHTSQSASTQGLLRRRHVCAMLFLIGMYGIWNLWAGTFGAFFPYFLRTVAAQSQAEALALSLVGAPVALGSILFIFMRYVDRVNQRLMFAISAAIQVVAMSLFAIFPLTREIVIVFLLLSALGAGFGAQSFFQLWSAELFPTLLRSTAQGITIAVVRIGLGIWSFFVPVLASAQFETVAWILTAFLVISGLIGVIWAPRNTRKSLKHIDEERALQAEALDAKPGDALP
jgi:MFS transporter, SP family, inositol transporter